MGILERLNLLRDYKVAEREEDTAQARKGIGAVFSFSSICWSAFRVFVRVGCSKNAPRTCLRLAACWFDVFAVDQGDVSL